MRKQIDSARMYVGGKTEELLGDVMEKEKSLANLRVASKANPWYGDLSRVGVRKQLEDTLKALKSECVDVFYLHGPDAKHDIRETLDEVQKMYEEKKFERFALSNFTAWETMYIHNEGPSQSSKAKSVCQVDSMGARLVHVIKKIHNTNMQEI